MFALLILLNYWEGNQMGLYVRKYKHCIHMSGY